VRYIFDKALKWHVSSFIAKSSPAPAERMPLVEDWLRRMGHRFVLRRLTCPARARPHGVLPSTSWREEGPCWVGVERNLDTP